MNDLSRRDILGTTVGEYGARFGAQFGAGAAANINSNVSNRAGDTNSTSNSTHIGSITVISGKGDAAGIAGDMGSAIERQNLATSVNVGPQ